MTANRKTRCSSLPRLALCAGSGEATKTLQSESTAESTSGDRIHLALEANYRGLTDEVEQFIERRLTDRELIVFYWFRNEADNLIEKHGGAAKIVPEYRFGKEFEGYADDFVLTGHIDLYVACNDGTILIIDWKTGQGEVTVARRNWQLRGYACGVDDGVRTVNAFIFSAGNEEGERFTGVQYTPEGLAQAFDQVYNVISHSREQAAPRTVSIEGCKYCEACGTDACPESIENVKQTAQGFELIKTSPPSLPASQRDVADVFRAIKQVESFARTFMKMLKAAVVENPDEWADEFELKEGNKMRTIADVQAVYDRIVGVNELVSGEDFIGSVDLSIGKFEKLLKEPLKANGILVKDQKEHIANLLGDLLIVTQNDPSIKLVEPVA